MPGMGGAQIIGGQSYQMYTPAWYKATEDQRVHDAGVAGTAQGTGAGNEATTYLDKLKESGLSLLSGLSSGSGGSTSGGSGSSAPLPPQIAAPSLTGLSAAVGDPRPGGSGGGSPTLAPVDTTAAENASFNRAKDTVGQTSSGALAGLRSALAGRGLLGSGAESRGTASVVNSGQQQLGDVTRQNAITSADNAQKNAQVNYEGGVTMRGQDLTAQNSGYEGQIAQRGQDINAQIERDRIDFARTSAAAQQQQSALQGLLAALGPTSGRTY